MFNNIYRFTLMAVTYFVISILSGCSSQEHTPTQVVATNHKFTVASPFQNKMVLQRNKAINIWGTGTPEAQVQASISGKHATSTVDSDGKWFIALPPQAAGGPYQVVISNKSNEIRFDDVLIGDVWYLSGQSNMVWPIRLVNDTKQITDDLKNNDKVRYLHVEQQASLTERNRTKMYWQDTSHAQKWSAVAAFFAQKQQSATNIPVGVIVSAWGASSIEEWLPSDLSEKLPHFASRLEYYQSIDESWINQKISKSHNFSSNEEAIAAWSKIDANKLSTKQFRFLRTRPSVLFNRMVAPLLPYSVSGFIWYQGEANASTKTDIAQYPKTLTLLITNYRRLFNQGDLPFFVVQLPSINREKSRLWQDFRLAQSSVTKLNNVHIATTVDTGTNSKQIHPKQKKPIGERLSLLARKYALGEDIVADGPAVNSIETNNGKIIITFKTESALITTNGEMPAMFEVSGKGGEFVHAKAKIINMKQVELFAPSIKKPVKVRYAHHMMTKGNVNLTNVEGLPTAPFVMTITD